MRDDRDRYYGGSNLMDNLVAMGIGAIVAVAAMSMIDPRKRRAMKRRVDEWMDDGRDALDHLEEGVEDVKEKGRRKLATELKRASDNVAPKRS